MAHADFEVGWEFDVATRQVVMHFGLSELRSKPLGETEGAADFVKEALNTMVEQRLISAGEFFNALRKVRLDFEAQGHRWQSAS